MVLFLTFLHTTVGQKSTEQVRTFYQKADHFRSTSLRPCGIGFPESAQNGSVAYQVLKVEKSISSALALSPGGVSQNHMTDFLKTVPTRNLRGGTRHMSSGHEVRRYTPTERNSLNLRKPTI